MIEMGNNAVRLQAQTGYIVVLSSDFGKFDQTTFLKFYQPLMSPTAMGLFYALQVNPPVHPVLTDRQAHQKLMVQLNSGIQAIDQARQQLEALELLKTFQQIDDLGEVLIYELHPTLSPAEFLADDLLSVLLLQMVGEISFNQLAQLASQHQFDHADLTEVTTSFLDVYTVGKQAFKQVDPVIEKARQANPATPAKLDVVNDPDFDWELLGQQLQLQGIDQQVITDHQQTIMAEHLLYQLDEFKLAELMVKAVDLTTNQFDVDNFKQLVRQQAQPDSRANVEAPETNEDLRDLSDIEKRLVKQVQAYSPLEYLTGLKNATNSGYVSNNERYTLERLVEAQTLPISAINVLLHYVIVEQGKASLNANLVDAIANTWTRNGVKSASDAIRALKDYQKQRVTKPRSTWRPSNAKPVKEKLPEWAKKPDYQPRPAKKVPAQGDLSNIEDLKSKLRQQQNDQP